MYACCDVCCDVYMYVCLFLLAVVDFIFVISLVVMLSATLAAVV